ncbi:MULTISPECIES: sigma 54-interacting transcriptional regulator [Kordiimonas]|jgi:two-component system nitrogen regulation response regulator GlnG|uniref:sigma 54-interacting transcriptional regulator n=1 Tax=Kordiimonas TaxID=288021 RepID=UPI00257CD56A|nr:sigma 54-interacting transcriptional regulator [Kordiimonas sp. UBA4487]
MQDETGEYGLMDETVSVEGARTGGPGREILLPSLGIIWHPDASRIGAVAPLMFGRATEASVSRNAPQFRKRGVSEEPLADRRISRSEVKIKRVGPREFSITPPDSKMKVLVNGHQVTAPVTVSLDALGDDIIITLAGTIVLSLFLSPAEAAPAPPEGRLLGVSGAMQAIWRAISRVAPTHLPVLIRGETGTGKELVAQALHLASDRAAENLVSINMATLSKELGAADLFGATKGAFTGAVRDRVGFFETADASTIFLDEIGDTPADLQAMLLRVLETGEFRRVGETRLRYTGARVLAATDRPLGADDFSQPLLRRLESMVIEMPPLRHRRVDIGILIKHFLDTGSFGAAPTDFTEHMTAMVLHDWPGNVRELRNAVQQMSVGQVPAFNVPEMGPTGVPQMGPKSSGVPKAKPSYRAPASVTEAEMLAALDATDWRIKEAAEHLNVSRTALYGLMEKSNSVRTLEDISDADIRTAMEAHPGDIGAWARALKVPHGVLERHTKKMMFD